MAIQRIDQEARLGFTPAPSNAGALAAAGQASSLRPISDALNGWLGEEQEQLEQRALIAVQDRATVRQREMGATALASPEAGLAQRFQLAQRAAAETTLNMELKREAALMGQQLRSQFFNDPQGFQQGWRGFQDSVTARFRASDPALAANVGGVLEVTGAVQFVWLADRKAAQDRADNVARTFAALEETKSVALDQQLQTPDPVVLQEQLREFSNELGLLHSQGLVTLQEVNAAVASNRVDFQRSYLRGVFTQDLKAGDVHSAVALLDALSEGRHFDQQEQAFQLRGELESLLPKEGQAGFDPGVAVSRLRRDVEGVMAGGDQATSQQVLADTASQVAATGTPAQQEEFTVLAGTLGLTKALRNAITGGSTSDIQKALDAVDSPELRFAVTTPAKGVLRKLGADQMAKITLAVSTGDFTSAAPPEVSQQITDQLFSLSPEELQRLTAAQRLSAAFRAGRKPEFVSPYTAAQVDSLVTAYTAASGEGRADDADDALSRFVAPYTDATGKVDLGLLLGDSTRFSTGGREAFLTPALLHAVGSPDLSLTWSRLSVQGGALLRTPDADTYLRGMDSRFSSRAEALAELQKGSRWSSAVKNLASGDPVLEQRLWGNVLDVLAGAFADTGNLDAAKQEVQRLLTPFQEGVAFANGARMPTKFLAGFPTGVQAVVGAVNQFLENPAMLGVLGFTDAQMRRLQPRILPGGAGIGFVDPSVSGRFLRHEGKPGSPWITVVPQDAVAAAGASSADLGNAPLLTRVAETVAATLAVVTPKVGLLADLHSVGETFEALPQGGALADAVVFSTRVVAEKHAAQMGTRLPPFFLRPEVELGVSKDRVWQRMGKLYGATGFQEAPTVFNKAAQPIYAGFQMEAAVQAFPGEPRAQLAAYWLGADSVNKLKALFGEQWAAHLVDVDPAAHAFVANAMRTFEARQGGVTGPTLFSELPSVKLFEHLFSEKKAEAE